MRKSVIAIAAIAAIGLGGVGASGLASAAVTPTTAAPSHANPLDLHAGQVHPASVPVSGQICGGVTGGNCWWESAVQLWYNMQNNINEQSEMATIYSEYGGDFQDGWTDDNAWWGIAFQKAYNLYGVANYHTKAVNLWTWDTTPGEGWDTACGGSTIQHSGGAENGISRASLGQLAFLLGKTTSYDNAANWLEANLQPNGDSGFVSEGLTPGTCTADAQNTTDHPTIGLETEAWKVMNEAGNSGQTGARASAVAKNPDPIYNGEFQLLFNQYIG